MFRRSALLLLALAFTTPSFGQDWAKKMFKEQNHDFGTVARNAKSEFLFEFVNPYKEDAHITSVRTSCNCTTPSIYQGKDTLKSWEKGHILAVFNTGSFLGQRAATITVTFDKPFPAEVQLRITGNIRSDIEFQPGVIDFATVDQGKEATTQVTVIHHNRSDWKLNDIRSANENLEVELSQPMRRNAGVAYTMTVHLKKTAPAGALHDQLTLVSNDSSAPNIPVVVQGNIVPPLAISPATLFLGVLQPGQSVTKQLVVRGKLPFKVSEIVCPAGDCIRYAVKDEMKTLHLIPITFTAGEKPGDFNDVLTIKTDLEIGGVVNCPCKATIKANEAVAGNTEKTTVLKPAE